MEKTIKQDLLTVKEWAEDWAKIHMEQFEKWQKDDYLRGIDFGSAITWEQTAHLMDRIIKGIDIGMYSDHPNKK